MTNEEKYNVYKKKKILRYLMIIFSFLTIVLESFALFKAISFLFGLIPFSLLYITKYYYGIIDDDTKREKKEKKNKNKKNSD